MVQQHIYTIRLLTCITLPFAVFYLLVNHYFNKLFTPKTFSDPFIFLKISIHLSYIHFIYKVFTAYNTESISLSSQSISDINIPQPTYSFTLLVFNHLDLSLVVSLYINTINSSDISA